MGTLYGVDGDLLERQYRNHLSNYLHWDQLAHAENWLLFEKNIGAYVCIDEVALSRGELYTVLINKETHGGKGSIIGIIKGTDVCTVTSVLLKLSRRRRYQVREITLDMAPNMEQIARTCFPAAKRVTDRFHVQKLAYEAVQEMRVKARWEALDEESIQIAYAKACGKMYHAPVFANGDTRKQLLARSIYLLYKKESLWTQSQRIRAEILFKEYPDIKKGYYMAMRLGSIYHQCKFKDIALTRLARWYDEVDKTGFLTFGRVARSIQTHYMNIINFFERRTTNAAAESSVEDPIPPTAEATCSAPLLTQQTNPDGFAVLQTMETWFKTYMDYRCITDSASIQYQLQQQAWTDEQGLRRIASDYLVAMGTGWLENGCGERFSVTLDTGATFTVQVGDVKADCHTDPTHCYRPCGSGANVLEFIVDTSALDTAVCNAGTISAYPAFSGNIVALTPLDSE